MPKLLHKYLRDEGGSKDATGDYSSIAKNFSYTPEAGLKWITIGRLIGFIKDSGQPDMDKYGNNITLTNGITLKILRASGELEDLLDGETIKTNGDWSAYNYDATDLNYGTGDDGVRIRWSFGKYYPLEGNRDVSEGIKLHQGDYFLLGVSDNFSGLTGHHFFLEGQKSETW